MKHRTSSTAEDVLVLSMFIVAFVAFLIAIIAYASAHTTDADDNLMYLLLITGTPA